MLIKGSSLILSKYFCILNRIDDENLEWYEVIVAVALRWYCVQGHAVAIRLEMQRSLDGASMMMVQHSSAKKYKK